VTRLVLEKQHVARDGLEINPKQQGLSCNYKQNFGFHDPDIFSF